MVPAAVVLFVALYTVWYPRIFSIVDESTYLSTAYAYRAGTIYHDEAGISSVTRVVTDGHRVSKFGPLMPLLLAPFTWIGWQATFAANLLMHLIGFWLFLRLVREERAPPWTALLYLFHPTLVFYSRTLMSDVASGVFFLAAFLFVRRRGVPAGLLLGTWAGVSCLVRETNVVLVALLLAALLIEDLRKDANADGVTRERGLAEWRFARVGAVLAGLVPPAAVLIGYHLAAFGLWWRGTAGYHGESGLSIEFGLHLFPGGLLHYGAALLLVYPGMLIALFVDRRRSLVATLPALGFVLFFCFYYYHDRAPTPVESAVTGLRFLIPVLPIFLLAYARVLARLFARWRVPGGAIATFLLVVGLGGAAAVHARHDAHLRSQETNRDALYETTPDGATILGGIRARELVHEVWGVRRFVRCGWAGRWTFPEEAGDDEVFVALVGGDRAGDPLGVPDPLQRLLDDGEARLVRQTDVDPVLRIWRIAPGKYRAIR